MTAPSKGNHRLLAETEASAKLMAVKAPTPALLPFQGDPILCGSVPLTTYCRPA